MEKVKEITREVEPSVPTCRFCGCLIAKPCESLRESWSCPNNQIDYRVNLPEDFDPNLN